MFDGLLGESVTGDGCEGREPSIPSKGHGDRAPLSGSGREGGATQPARNGSCSLVALLRCGNGNLAVRWRAKHFLGQRCLEVEADSRKKVCAGD